MWISLILIIIYTISTKLSLYYVKTVSFLKKTAQKLPFCNLKTILLFQKNNKQFLKAESITKHPSL